MDMVSRDHIDIDDGHVAHSSISRTESDPMNVVSEHGSVDRKAEDVLHPESNVTENGTTTEKPSTLPPLLVPSLKGKMTYEGGNVTCKGVWGMSDLAHNHPAQLSEFEFKLVKADEDSSLFPVNGRYQGHFYLKQALPMKGSVKIEDKEMMFKFTPSDEGGGQYVINGNGLNRFGSFTLKGTLSEEGDLHVYREYYNLTPAPVPHVKRRMSIDGAEDGPKSKKKVLSIKADESLPLPPMDPNVSPREGTGRVRKQSLVMKEYVETAVKAPPSVTKPPKEEKAQPFALKQPKTPVPSVASSAVSLQRHDTSDRAQRLSAPLKKCSELLKEMAKHPHSVWFLEPVDHVRLNIPDYPLIISSPMDFSTVKKRIEASLYETADAFAEDMRLVFRNAITFNTQRDNPVHIAAREMSVRFEDRYRVLTTQLGGTNAYSAAAIMAIEAGKSPRVSIGAAGPSSSKKGKTPRPSLGGKSSSGAGPRQSLGAGVPAMSMPYMPPAVDGSSAHQLMEMQRMMQAMQNEISTLKSQVRENEIVKRLQETKDAAHNPLTFDEKKTLIAQIHKLAPEKMEHVLNIIQDALPPRENDDDAEIEIPLDALDTFTLRKLQKFIEDNSEKKKRAPPALQRQSSGGGAAQRSSSSGDGPAPKRARKPSAAKMQAQHGGAGMLGGDMDMHGGELELFQDEGEDMLFEPDSFEELKAHAQRDAQQHGHGGGSAGMHMDDDTDFSALVNMNNHAAPISSNDITVRNMDAWNNQ